MCVYIWALASWVVGGLGIKILEIASSGAFGFTFVAVMTWLGLHIDGLGWMFSGFGVFGTWEGKKSPCIFWYRLKVHIWTIAGYLMPSMIFGGNVKHFPGSTLFLLIMFFGEDRAGLTGGMIYCHCFGLHSVIP